jgi:energy-coupling factor transporter ATP-binding protein EcfA2
MAFLREISIEGLFGLYDHSIELRRDPPVTFVAGPNGIGKTTLLRLTHALLSGNYRELSKQQFSRLAVSSEAGTLLAEPHVSDDEGTPRYAVVLQLTHPRRQPKEVTIDLIGPRGLHLPSWLEPTGPDLFLDRRTGRVIDTEEVEHLYLSPSAARRRRIHPPEPPDWFIREDWTTDFIETKRLDSLLMKDMRSDRERERDGPARPPIDYYLDEVYSAIRSARLESSRRSQLSDRSFARRMLERSGPRSVNEEKLRERYSGVERIATEVARNGLLAESLDFLPAGRLTPTEKRVMSLFLDDFEAKMEPLQPISAKVNQLREIVDSKFLNKHMAIDPDRGPVFIAEPDGTQLAADALSSGEQHELALVSRLLFSVGKGTTVLVDEPELSLHVSWQHRMLKDLSGIAELVGLSFLLATHSTAIINGRWDLVEELGPLDDRDPA